MKASKPSSPCPKSRLTCRWPNFTRESPKAIIRRDPHAYEARSPNHHFGGIFAIEPGEKAKQIVKDFTKSLLRWNGNLIVVSGLEHMGVDHGLVHRIVRDGNGWKSEFLHALPGCPRHASVLADGRLFANCEGGAVVITPAGEFEYLGSGKARDPAEDDASEDDASVLPLPE
jgi:hypothetical protein